MPTWARIYAELVEELLPYRDRQKDLIRMLEAIEDKGLKIISLTDVDASDAQKPLEVMDPFTFFANFNSRTTQENRRSILAELMRELGLRYLPPSDFAGLPVVNLKQSWFFPYEKTRKPGDIEALWDLAESCLAHFPWELEPKVFERCLTIPTVGPVKLTIGLHWLSPKYYLQLDSRTIRDLKIQGVEIPDRQIKTLPAYLEIIHRYLSLLDKAVVTENRPQITIKHYPPHRLPLGDPPDKYKLHDPDRLRLGDPLDTYFLGGAVIYDEGWKQYLLLGIKISKDALPYPEETPNQYSSEFHLRQIESRWVTFTRTGWEAKNAEKCNLDKKRQAEIDDIVLSMWEQIVYRPHDEDFIAPEITAENINGILSSPDIQLAALQKHHERELIRIAKRLDFLDQTADRASMSTDYDFNVTASKAIHGWFARNNLDVPRFEKPEAKKLYKDDYRKLAEYYYAHPEIGPEETKRVLNDDKARWSKNPSQYLHPWRRDKGIPVKELKKHPNFTWIDPKNTSID